MPHRKPVIFARSLCPQFLALVFLLTLGLAHSNTLAAPLTSHKSSAPPQPQTSQRRNAESRTAQIGEVQDTGFVTYAEGKGTACRDMTESEVRTFRRDAEQIRQMRVITPQERSAALRQDEFSAESATGLTIILRSTAQLDANTAAKDAFIRAAAAWEAQIKNPITVVIDVDFGTTRFGTTYPAGVLGSTGTPSYLVPYTTMRPKIVSSSSGSAESSLYNLLPPSNISTDLGTVNYVSVGTPLMRAFGLITANADPATDSTAPSIGFNSNFTFDFDPTDGITAGAIDFDAVAVHEMGHALGFVSNVGLYELYPTSTKAVTLWDIFRFRPGARTSTFTYGTRVLSSGGDQRFFAGAPELATSTGRPNATGGDGRQASHWKADELSGNYLGIMDPTLAAGDRKTMTNNDLQVLEAIGYKTVSLSASNLSTCTYSLSAPSTVAALGGATGSVSVTASSSSCTWTATSNTAWISVTSGASGTGDGTVGFSVQANTGEARSGSITIAGQTFAVEQNGCGFTLSYSANSFPATASTGSLTVTASANTCVWTASSNDSWLTVTSGASGTGSGTVNFSVAQNATSSVRVGSFSVAGYNFTITQAAGVASCYYNMGSFLTNFDSLGGTTKIIVGTTATCTWKGISTIPWIKFTPSTNITGSGSLTMAVAQNTGPSARSSVVTIAGRSFTITQRGR